MMTMGVRLMGKGMLHVDTAMDEDSLALNVYHVITTIVRFYLKQVQKCMYIWAHSCIILCCLMGGTNTSVYDTHVRFRAIYSRRSV